MQRAVFPAPSVQEATYKAVIELLNVPSLAPPLYNKCRLAALASLPSEEKRHEVDELLDSYPNLRGFYIYGRLADFFPCWGMYHGDGYHQSPGSAMPSSIRVCIRL